MAVNSINAAFSGLQTGGLTSGSSAEALEKDPQEAQKASALRMVSEKGDTVEISTKAQILSQAATSAKEASTGTSSLGNSEKKDSTAEEDDAMVKSIKEQIKSLQKQIEKLQDSDMPEKEKQQQIALLQQEVATQTEALNKLQNGGGKSSRYGQGGLVF